MYRGRDTPISQEQEQTRQTETDVANRAQAHKEKAIEVGTQVLGAAARILEVAPIDPFCIIAGIFGVTRIIYEQVQSVQANKEQFIRLTERIATIENAIRGLETIPRLTQYEEGLNKFQSCVNECLAFVQEFGQKSWFKRILGAGTYSDKFEYLANTLQQVGQDLNLGLQAQQLINQEQNRQDQAKDRADILARQEEIQELQQESMKELQKLAMDAADRYIILKAQLESIESRLKELSIPRDKREQHPIDPRDIVPFYDLAINELIRKGSFASVYLGEWCAQQVAVKKIEGTITPAERDQFIREVQIMSRLRSPYITLFQGACLEPERATLVMEYMEEGSVYDAIGRIKLKPKEKAEIVLDIGKGLLYLHSQWIIHRDLTSGNVLLNKYKQVKITDFGLSKIQTSSIGTAREVKPLVQWMAPELFERGGCYSTKSDVYAYGIIIWELITERRPYEGLNESAIIRLKGSEKPEDQLIISEEVSKIYADTIRRCTAKNPSERPELREIINIFEKYCYELEALDICRKGKKKESRHEYEKAEVRYNRAKEMGCGGAYASIGFWYLTGSGGKKEDKKEAFRLLLIGAEKGDAKAQFNAGQMLEYGDGVDKDLLKAYELYKQSAAQGYASAQDRIRRIKEKIKEAGLDTTASRPKPNYS